jgi:hypothetical protein
MALAFSCDSMATLRTDFAILSKPCCFIHSENARLQFLPQAALAPVTLRACCFPTASAPPINFHDSKLSARLISSQASRPARIVRVAAIRSAASFGSSCWAMKTSFGNVTGARSRGRTPEHTYVVGLLCKQRSLGVIPFPLRSLLNAVRQAPIAIFLSGLFKWHPAALFHRLGPLMNWTPASS